MDWKILTVVVMGLVIFGLVRFCSNDDKADWDKTRAIEMAKTDALQESEKAKNLREKKTLALEKAIDKRGERPEEKTATLESDDFTATFTTRGGSIRSFELKHDQYVEKPRDWSTGTRDKKDDKSLAPVNMVTTNPEFELNNPLRFEIYQGIDGIIPDADFELVEQSADHVLFKYEQKDIPIIINKKFELDRDSGPYQIWVTVNVTNKSEKKIQFLPAMVQTGYQHSDEVGGGMFSSQPNLLQGLCRHGDELYREPWNESDALISYTGLNVVFAGVDTNYFISAMIPGDDLPVSCRVHASWPYGVHDDPSWGIVTSELRWGEINLAPGQSQVFKVKNYIGPKRYKQLQAIGNDLEESVDFGWFAPISRILLWLLFMFQRLVLNWGVAIILLTITVKLVLMPVAHKAFKSTDRMKALKPEVDKLNEKFKDNPQEKQKQIMALYKQNKVNPLGGCLPMVLQMPIWFALFRTLRSSPELYRADFFGWIHDLSQPDPYYVTPLLMGVAMFLQQRLTPMAGDNAQAKMMMYLMPIMFTAMMFSLPSGLTLYIFVNVLLSIGHQLIIQKMRDRSTT